MRISVESHGVAHKAWSAMAPLARENDFKESKRILESGLGKPVRLFSHPYGDIGTNTEPVDAVLSRHGYAATCLYGGGPIDVAEASRYLLPRVAVGPDTDLVKILGTTCGA